MAPKYANEPVVREHTNDHERQRNNDRGDVTQRDRVISRRGHALRLAGPVPMRAALSREARPSPTDAVGPQRGQAAARKPTPVREPGSHHGPQRQREEERVLTRRIPLVAVGRRPLRPPLRTYGTTANIQTNVASQAQRRMRRMNVATGTITNAIQAKPWSRNTGLGSPTGRP